VPASLRTQALEVVKMARLANGQDNINYNPLSEVMIPYCVGG